MICEGCGTDNDTIKSTPAATAYYWDGKGEDPNRDVIFCEECRNEYYDYWQEMWDEYYTSITC